MRLKNIELDEWYVVMIIIQYVKLQIFWFSVFNMCNGDDRLIDMFYKSYMGSFGDREFNVDLLLLDM